MEGWVAVVEASARSTTAELKTSGLICPFKRIHGDVEVFQLSRRFTSRGKNTWYQQMYGWRQSLFPRWRFMQICCRSNAVQSGSDGFAWELYSTQTNPSLDPLAPRIVLQVQTHHHPKSSLFLLSSLYSSPKRVKLPSPWFGKCFCSVRKSQWGRIDYCSLHRIQHLMILHGLLSKFQSRCFLQLLSHITIDVINPGVFSSPLLTANTAVS